jgi:hypothetical protein
MSGFYGGTDSAYSSASPYRFYVDVSGTDREFVTGLSNPVYNTSKQYTVQKCVSNSTLDLLNRDPRLMAFRDFIVQNGYTDLLNGDYTLFAPVEFTATDLDPLYYFQYHKLDFPVFPEQLISRKGRLTTSYRDTIFHDGLNLYSNGDSNTPVKVLQSMVTDNGIVYIVDRTLIPITR